jgi:hypothetical protein
MFAPLSEYGPGTHDIYIHLSNPMQNKIKEKNYSNMPLNQGKKRSKEVILKL